MAGKLHFWRENFLIMIFEKQNKTHCNNPHLHFVTMSAQQQNKLQSLIRNQFTKPSSIASWVVAGALVLGWKYYSHYFAEDRVVITIRSEEGEDEGDKHHRREDGGGSIVKAVEERNNKE